MDLKPLFLAIANNDENAIYEALKAGCDPFATDENNIDAFDFAKRFATEDTFNRLLTLVAESENKDEVKIFSKLTERGVGRKTSITRSEISIDEFEIDEFLETEDKEIDLFLTGRSKKNLHDPRNDEFCDYDYEDQQEFGREFNRDDDESLVFTGDIPALSQGIDLDDAFELCEKHVFDLPDNAKRLLSIYLYARGGDAAFFMRFTEKTESRLRRITGITDDQVDAICDELDGFFDQSIQELFSLLSEKANNLPANRKELTVALVLDLARKIIERSSAN